MAYEPIPGTLPYRAIQYLKSLPAGAELSSAELADALDADIAGFTTTLMTAKKYGFLRGRTKPDNGRLMFWSLGDGTPEPLPPDHEPDEPLPTRSATQPRAGAWPAPASAPAAGEQKQLPLFGLFSDGSLSIEDHNQSMTLNASSAKMLADFLARSWPRDTSTD